MKGDFSKRYEVSDDNFAGVLYQQGRVFLDADGNAQTWITSTWQDTAGRDVIGPNVAAVPADQPASFKVQAAELVDDTVTLTIGPGRVWADGLLLRLDETPPVTRVATYLQPPIQDPPFDESTIAAGVRDAVVLEVWRETINGFQIPDQLIEPALGGPDTTERVHTASAYRLFRLGSGQCCDNIADDLADDFANKGRLTVTLEPPEEISGDCPVAEGGGYTGFEHHTYRIEIAETNGGPTMFKWSQFMRRDPELIISEQPEGICAHIEPHGANHGDYLVVKSDAARVEVTRFSADHKRLFELIPAEGLHLPFEAKTRLMEAVSALSRQIRIHSSVAGDHLTATQIVGAHEPWVQLVPAGMGLSITLRVEPVPESGVYVDPGKGGETLLVEHAGETIEAIRDHAAETAAVDELVDTCQSLRRAYDGRNFYQYADPADCLELLEELHAAKAKCLWPQGERYRVVARVDTSQLNLTIKPAAQWFAASGSLRVNEDKVLGLAELLSLLEANPQSRFLEIDDGQFIALSVAFRRQLDELLGLSTPVKGKSVRFHRLAAPALEELVEQSNCDIDDAWRSLRTRLAEAHSFKPDLPSTLRAELRPYQHDGFRWLAQVSHWGVGACLADDMGLGKTVEALALLLHRASGGPALVVAPTSVVTNWVEEAQRFAPTLNVVTYTGTAQTRARLLSELAPLSVVVITYGLLQNDLERLADIEWHSVVLDEAQNIKNAATKRAQAARRLNAQFRLATAAAWSAPTRLRNWRLSPTQ